MAHQADQQSHGGDPGQFVHRRLRLRCPKPAGDCVPAGDDAGAACRRGEQSDAQEAPCQGEPERHGECYERSVELLPLGDVIRHPRCVTCCLRCVKLRPASSEFEAAYVSDRIVPIRVWDAPTRLFHWATVILLGSSWLTESRGWMELHFLSGYSVIALLLFRIAWGFVGSETARFSHFVKRPDCGFAAPRPPAPA